MPCMTQSISAETDSAAAKSYSLCGEIKKKDAQEKDARTGLCSGGSWDAWSSTQLWSGRGEGYNSSEVDVRSSDY